MPLPGKDENIEKEGRKPSGDAAKPAEHKLDSSQKKVNQRLQAEVDQKAHGQEVKNERSLPHLEKRLARKTAGREKLGECVIVDHVNCGKDQNTKVHFRNGLPDKIHTPTQDWERVGNTQTWKITEGNSSFNVKANVEFKGENLSAKLIYSNGTEITYKNAELAEIKLPKGDKLKPDPERPGIWELAPKPGDNSPALLVKELKIDGSKGHVSYADHTLPPNDAAKQKLPAAADKVEQRPEQLQRPKIEKSAEQPTYKLPADKDISNLNGTLKNADGSQIYRVDHGQIIDAQHKIVAKLLSDGTLQYPQAKPARAEEDLNVAFRNFKFAGTENGLARHFSTSNKMPDGKMFLPGTNNTQIECKVRLGMVIDVNSGRQIGQFTEPPSYQGDKLNPGKIAFANDPDHPVSLNDPRLKNSLFDIGLKGQVFGDHRRLQGICTGESTNPIMDLQNLIKLEKQVTQIKENDFQSKIVEKTFGALLGDNKVYKDHEAIADNLIKVQQDVSNALRTGKFDKMEFSHREQTANDFIRSHSADSRNAQTAKQDVTEKSMWPQEQPKPGEPKPGDKHAPAEHIVPKEHIASQNTILNRSSVEATDPHQDKTKLNDKGDKHEVQKEPPKHRAVDVPALSLKDSLKMNGMLRIDEDVYHIKAGWLYKVNDVSGKPVESSKPCGRMGPDYLFQMVGGKNVESLADQNRVLLKYHIDGDKSQNSEHMLVGVGAGYVNKAGEKVPGGLIRAHDLVQASISNAYDVDKNKADVEGRRNFLDKGISSTITAGLDKDQAEKVEVTKTLAIETTQHLLKMFKTGFDPVKVHASDFDSQNKEIRQLMTDCNISAKTSADLIQKNEITNTLIREGVITGVNTVASIIATAATDGMAAPVAAANIAKAGQLANLARTMVTVGAPIVAVGASNYTMRYKDGQTAEKGWRDIGDGALQGIGMKIPLGKLKTAGDLIPAAEKATAQAALFQGGQYLREGKSPTELLSKEGATNVIAGAGLALLTHGMTSELAERFPILRQTVADADSKLADCAELRRTGGADAKTIEKLATEAMVKKEVAGYLIQMTTAGTAGATYSALPAVPEAIGAERKRIAEKLGKQDISTDELLRNIKVENIVKYVMERAAVSGGTAAILGGITKPITDSVAASTFEQPKPRPAGSGSTPLERTSFQKSANTNSDSQAGSESSLKPEKHPNSDIITKPDSHSESDITTKPDSHSGSDITTKPDSHSGSDITKQDSHLGSDIITKQLQDNSSENSQSVDQKASGKELSAEKNPQAQIQARVELDSVKNARENCRQSSEALVDAKAALDQSLGRLLNNKEVQSKAENLAKIQKAVEPLDLKNAPITAETLSKVAKILTELDTPESARILNKLPNPSENAKAISNKLVTEFKGLDELLLQMEQKKVGKDLKDFVKGLPQSDEIKGLTKDFNSKAGDFQNRNQAHAKAEAALKELEGAVRTRLGDDPGSTKDKLLCQQLETGNPRDLAVLVNILDRTATPEQSFKRLYELCSEFQKVPALKTEFGFLYDILDREWTHRATMPTNLPPLGQKTEAISVATRDSCSSPAKVEFVHPDAIQQGASKDPLDLMRDDIGKQKNYFAQAVDIGNGNTLIRRFDVANNDSKIKGYVDVYKGENSPFPGIHFLFERGTNPEPVDVKFKQRLLTPDNKEVDIDHVPMSNEGIKAVLSRTYDQTVCKDSGKGSKEPEIISPDEFRNRVCLFYGVDPLSANNELFANIIQKRDERLGGMGLGNWMNFDGWLRAHKFEQR